MRSIHVAVRVDGLYVTTAPTCALDGSRNSKVVVLIVAGSIASLNVAVTFALKLTPLAR